MGTASAQQGWPRRAWWHAARSCQHAQQLAPRLAGRTHRRRSPAPASPRRLGPRKAQHLLRAVTRQGGYVESRQQVWRELGVMGNRVFRNCGAFLRVRPAVKGGWLAGWLAAAWALCRKSRTR